MPKEMQDGLAELLAFSDGGGSAREEDTGAEENPDLKSSSGEHEDDAAGEAAPEGAKTSEGELAAETGEEDGGTAGEEEEASKENESEIAELKAELKKLQEMIGAKEGESTSDNAVASAATTAFEGLKPEIQDIDVMGGLDYEDITESEESFTKWAKQLVSKVQEVTQEAVYRNIPGIIQSYTDQQIEVKSQAQKFYQTNPDLAEHKAEVAKNANLLAQAEPGLSSDEFFKKVADYTRYTLKLPGKEKGGKKEEKQTPGGKPALNKRSTKASSRMSKPPELEGMDKEISEMLKQIE